MWITVVLIVSQALAGDQAVSAGWQRLLATLLGVAVAFLVIVILMVISGNLRHKKSTDDVSPTSQAQ